MSSVIETKRTADTLTISIPVGTLTVQDVERIVEMVKAQAIVSKSKLTQSQADEIARDINKSWWLRNAARIEKMIDGE